MEKRLNKYIKKVLIKDDCFSEINSLIEENFVNTKVIFVVDFYTYQTHYLKLLELQKCSLNSVEIKVIYNEKKLENELLNLLNETYSMIVGIGGFNVLKFTKNFAIKTNINYAFVNLFSLKCEIFTDFLAYFDSFNQNSPIFVLVNKQNLTHKILFDLSVNLYKYSYVLFENYTLEFKKNYLDILTNINAENIYEKVVACGLLFYQNNIKFIVKNNYNDFNNFIYSQVYLLINKNILKKINSNNLYLIDKLNFSDKNSLNNYINFDVKFNKFYLLANKYYLLNKINKILEINASVLYKLKCLDIYSFYTYCKTCDKIKFKNIFNFNNTILNKMQYFEIFESVNKFCA